MLSRKIFRMRLASPDKTYAFYQQAVKTKSISPLRRRLLGDPERLLFPRMRSLIAGASDWSRWRKATPFPQSIIIVTSSLQAALSATAAWRRDIGNRHLCGQDSQG